MEEQISQQAEQPQPTVESQVYTQEEHSAFRKLIAAVRTQSFINASSWLLLFLLAPATILVLVSQNTVPGDFFYPVKRGLEDVVLAGASLNPTTKAVFRVDLTRRRFDEAEKLLLASANTAGLSELVTEIQATQVAVGQVKDPVQKKQLEQKLHEAYGEYEKRLVVVKVQLEAQQGVQPAQPSVTPAQPTSPQAQPTNTPVPIPTTRPGEPPVPTNTPVPLPTAGPLTTRAPTAAVIPSPTPTQPPTPTQSGPTQSPAPTGAGPTPPPTPVEAVGGTIGWLQCIQTRPHHECREPDVPQQQRQSERRLEDREERREERRQRREVREERREDRREERGEE